MKTQTKAELRDRIAELEHMLRHTNAALDSLHKQLIKEKERNWYSNSAAYACLAVIFILVGVEVIW
jgi:hypothetical protein